MQIPGLPSFTAVLAPFDRRPQECRLPGEADEASKRRIPFGKRLGEDVLKDGPAGKRWERPGA